MMNRIFILSFHIILYDTLGRDMSEKGLPYDPLKVGIVHILATKNNTIMTITDATGAETIAKKSGGMFADRDCNKPTPYVAFQVGFAAGSEARAAGISRVIVRVRGRGGNRSPRPNNRAAAAAIKALVRAGLRIISIEDVTPIPHDSIRKPGGRRGRRV